MIRDYRYPEFKDGFYSSSNKDKDFYETLLCGISFTYEFNEASSEVKLDNRVEILLKVRKILDEKGFSKTLKDRRTEDFNTIAIPSITKLVQSLFQVNGEILDPQEYDMKLDLKKPILRVTNRQWDKMPGIYERNYSINNEDRYLIEYQQIQIDSAKHRMMVNGNYYDIVFKEQKIQLLNIDEKEGARLIISGTVGTQLNKKVTLAYMRKPYGTELYQETVFLDEDNSFYIETEMKHAGLVFLVFGQTSSTIALPTIPLYVEPGSNIQIKASGEFPWEIKFTGDFADAQKMLYNFNKEHNWLKQKINFHSLSWWWLSQINYTDLTNAIDNLNSFTLKYKESMPEYVFEFVTKELKANLMCGILEYLRQIEFQRRVTWGTVFLKDKDLIDKNYLDAALSATEIHEIYNPYGLFSRQFANGYLFYHFLTIRKVHNLDFASYNTAPLLSTDLRLYGDLPHKIEVAKTILAGPALYGQIAEILVKEKTTVYNQKSRDITYRQNEVEKYLDLMFRLCNDSEFTNSLKKVINTQSQWEKKDYVPDVRFFDEKGEAKFMKDYLGEKPTVFYVTNNWGISRYHFDDLAKENTDINFVLVTEGSNIQEWMDYAKRAEPVAHQLFLINQEKQLRTIFKSTSQHFIAYDKDGVRIGFHGNMVSAMNLCKESLTESPKKELNKSQLQLIIIVLLAILTALIIGLTIWKWRIRQRFRKEEQNRKLRELELTAIRSQMNPHFLFNALNSVQNLVQQNKGREAHLYLADFAGLIRKVLNNSEKEEVSLAEELEMIGQYLSLEKLRFEFDFKLSADPGIDLHNTMVPSMLLQPFVENAVIHGLQNKQGLKQLKIKVSKSERGIEISIEDNGIGRSASKQIAKEKNGKGTKLMKERLEILQEKQGEKYSLEIVDLDEGTRVEIIIPEEK
ncbi:histidine kinase [Prolixibacteraceae bacterium Z1-6]|uniref:Histidine kinase n=1 Tax=Draconibacterium aestuarii TaxID=2998507 RepID=A0A9X3J5T0_9BACT|nr:histidine kinase [Prolixibacteraceae bacterium Z1-6]